MLTRRIHKTIHRICDRFLRLKGAPHEIALGFSLGIMVGMTPFIGVHILSCVVLASLLGWSKVASVIGVNITNVVTAPLIYPINYWVGVQLVGVSREVDWPGVPGYAEFLSFIRQSPLILVDLSIGGLVLGTPLAMAGYVIILRAVRRFR
ncbi:hypothetical protein DSCA_22700 [Desulfosarcina alkanivorans]|jgi:uncharacterized protein (DUF2062 family)|uniref:DUF2062 domain-containing protein n=1 Tax=Desulfosarcina alkanivorans TaxID=571177 RepID=A0A5K7YJL2_9BACT|nr:DUF2062 domain-containing protein [Desulfosarcina alkanivorans]BBO68340.1 hypothetical protein DSCA_22700 [Desulfosarcina alkanivorans]